MLLHTSVPPKSKEKRSPGVLLIYYNSIWKGEKMHGPWVQKVTLPKLSKKKPLNVTFYWWWTPMENTLMAIFLKVEGRAKVMITQSKGRPWEGGWCNCYSSSGRNPVQCVLIPNSQPPSYVLSIFFRKDSKYDGEIKKVNYYLRKFLPTVGVIFISNTVNMILMYQIKWPKHINWNIVSDFYWTSSLHFLKECPIPIVQEVIQGGVSALAMDREGQGLGFKETVISLTMIRTLMVMMTWTCCWCFWKQKVFFLFFFL